MYQALITAVLLFCFGGAFYVTVSHGSAETVYTYVTSNQSTSDSPDEDVAAITAPKEKPSFIASIVKSVFGIGQEANPILARTFVGTYACLGSTSTKTVTNCSSPYVFTFKKNSAAVLRIPAEEGSPSTTEVGNWSFTENNQIVVTLFSDGVQRFDQDRVFTLNPMEKGTGLMAVDYPKEHYPDIITGIFKFTKK
jgi:hypothetical protein